MSIATDTRICTRCRGNKVSGGFTATDGTVYPDRECYSCKGLGIFFPPDATEIATIIQGRGGKLRSAKPKIAKSLANLSIADRTLQDRCYYVWRMARFHGGADTTMPVMASLSGDPFGPELDAMVDDWAKRSFGSDLHATYRWGRAFGMF